MQRNRPARHHMWQRRSVEVGIYQVQVLGMTFPMPRHEGAHEVANGVKLGR
jgi:hypothetical protein